MPQAVQWVRPDVLLEQHEFRRTPLEREVLELLQSPLEESPEQAERLTSQCQPAQPELLTLLEEETLEVHPPWLRQRAEQLALPDRQSVEQLRHLQHVREFQEPDGEQLELLLEQTSELLELQ